jgi:hypothetical protein
VPKSQKASPKGRPTPNPPASMPPLQIPYPRLKTLLISLFKYLVAVLVGALGVIAGTATIWPNVHILPPAEPFDDAEPYKYPFILQNDGYLPVYNVRVQCLPVHISFDLFRSSNIAAAPGAFRFVTDELPRGDKRPFNCQGWRWLSGRINGKDFIPPGPLFRTTYADMKICTKFSVIPFADLELGCTDQVFQTQINDWDGKTYWREVRPELKRSN